MAQIKQVGVGRKTTGTIDGITYYVLNGKTFARSTPTMPVSMYTSTEARIRQAIFKFVQMHMKLHLRTIRQTITAKTGTPCNRYYSLNKKGLNAALQTLAEQYVSGVDVTISDVEQAISDYAAEHPQSICIASKSGYAEVYLTGAWPQTITLNASAGDSTVIIIVAENGVQTTINPDGSTIVVSDSSQGAGSDGTSQGSGSGGSDSGTGTNDGGNGNSGTGGGESPAVAAPIINGNTAFTDTTQVTISAESGAEIRYTTDGSTPTTSSSLYESALTLSDTTTVKAIAIKNGVSSSVASKTFTKGSGGSDNGDND